MSEQLQTKAVRVQSSAIVLAAVITTCGAVTSALIQTGWTTKLLSPSVAAVQQSPATRTSADLAEAFDVPNELAFAVPSPAASKPQTFATNAATVSFHGPLAESSPASATTTNTQTWSVSKPELAPAQITSRPLVSPWYYLKQPVSNDQRAESSTAAKKSFDWSTIPRWLQWHN